MSDEFTPVESVRKIEGPSLGGDITAYSRTPAPINHTLHEPWSSHVRALLQEVESCRAEELRLRGLILEVQERSNRRRANLQELIGLIVRDAGLPTDPAYSISPDGTTLTAELPKT